MPEWVGSAVYWGQSDYYFTPALPLPLSDFNGEIETSRTGARCPRQTSRRSGRRGKSQSFAMQAIEKAWLLAVYPTAVSGIASAWKYRFCRRGDVFSAAVVRRSGRHARLRKGSTRVFTSRCT